MFRNPGSAYHFALPFLSWLLSLSLGYNVAAAAPVITSTCKQEGGERGKSGFKRRLDDKLI